MKVEKTGKDILVIKLDHAGDVLWTTPALTTLRNNFPDARIRVCCTPYTAPVWENNPSVDEIIPYSGQSYPEDLARPDLALCLDTRTHAVKFTHSSKAHIRSGYYYFPRGFSIVWPLLLLTHPVLHPASRGDFAHEVEVNRRLLERLGCRTEPDTPTRLFLTQHELDSARQLLQQHGFYGGALLAVHLPSKWTDGNWPAAHVANLVDQLAVNWPEASLLLTCGPGEEPLLNAIQPLLKSRVLVITGQSFRNWAALLNHCSLLICRDCGPVHVAAALDVPVISVFEESKRLEHTRWEPWLVPHCNVFRPDIFSAAAEDNFLADIAISVKKLLD